MGEIVSTKAQEAINKEAEHLDRVAHGKQCKAGSSHTYRIFGRPNLHGRPSVACCPTGANLAQIRMVTDKKQFYSFFVQNQN